MTSTPDTATVNRRVTSINEDLIQRVTAHLNQVGQLARPVLWTGKGSIVVHFAEPMNVTATDTRFAPLLLNWSATFRSPDGAIYLNVPASWRKADREAGEGEANVTAELTPLMVILLKHLASGFVALQHSCQIVDSDTFAVAGGFAKNSLTGLIKRGLVSEDAGVSGRWLINDAGRAAINRPIADPTAPIPPAELENADEPHGDIGTVVSDEAPLTVPDQAIIEAETTPIVCPLCGDTSMISTAIPSNDPVKCPVCGKFSARWQWEDDHSEVPNQSTEPLILDRDDTPLRVNDWVKTLMPHYGMHVNAGERGAIVGLKNDKAVVTFPFFKTLGGDPVIAYYLPVDLRKIDPPEPTPDPVNDADAYAGAADAALAALEQADIERADEVDPDAYYAAQQREAWRNEDANADADEAQAFWEANGFEAAPSTSFNAFDVPVSVLIEAKAMQPADPYAWATPAKRAALDALVARKHVYPQILEPSTMPDVWRMEDQWKVKTMERTIDKLGGTLVSELEQDWDGDEPYCIALFKLEVDGRPNYEPFPSGRPSKPAADPNSIHAQYDALHDTLPGATQLLIQVNGDEWLAFQMDAMLLRRYAPLCRFTAQTINQAGEQWDKLTIPAGVLDELLTNATTEGGLTVALASIVRDEPGVLPVRDVTEIHRPDEPVQYIGKEAPPIEDAESEPQSEPAPSVVPAAPSKLEMTPELMAAKIRLHIHGELRLGLIESVIPMPHDGWFAVTFVHGLTEAFTVPALRAAYEVGDVWRSKRTVYVRTPQTATPHGSAIEQATAVVNALPDLTAPFETITQAFTDAKARLDAFNAAAADIEPENAVELLSEADETDLIEALRLEHADIAAESLGVTQFLLNVIARMRTTQTVAAPF